MFLVCQQAKGLPLNLEESVLFFGALLIVWVAMAMVSLWMPPLSSQLFSMSTSLPRPKCAGAVRGGLGLRLNLRRANVPSRRFRSCGGCPLLVVRASAMDAATELSTVSLGFRWSCEQFSC